MAHSDEMLEMDTTGSFVLKVRHRLWLKEQTAARKEHDSKANESKTLREILDEAILREKAGKAA